MSKRRDKIQGGGVFQHAQTAPMRDSEELTQQMHGQRPPDELAQVDREHEAKIRRHFGSFTITPTGLDLTGEPVFADWQEVGNFLFGMEKAIQWLVGDWLVYGEELKFGDMKKFADETGRNFASLRQYAYVSRNVSMRIDTLSWNHHLLVASLPDDRQQEALEYAAINNLTVKAFTAWLRGGVSLPSPDIAPLIDKDFRFRFSRVFRNLSEGTLDRIHADDFGVIRDWLDKAEGYVKSKNVQLKK